MRKRIELDLARVEELAANGLSEEEVAASMGVSRVTIQRRKREDEAFVSAWKRGKQKSFAEVTNTLMSLVREKNLGAVVWFEKTRKGYSDRVQQEVSGRDGAPISIETKHVFSHEAAITAVAGRPEEDSA